MKFAHLSEVNSGYVREVYEYESVEEMREKNHPNFYHFIVPAPDEVQKFWMFKDGAFEEPKMFEVVNGHVYLPRSLTAEEIGAIFSKNLELEKREKLVDEALAILVSVFDAHPDLISDEQANKMKNLYPDWGVDIAYEVNTRVRYEEKLYKCLQAHTSQSDWMPTVTPAMWVEIAAPGEYREIKDGMLSTEAFALGEIGWYQTEDNLWKSTIDANTYTPVTYPAGWEKYTEVNS